MGLIRNEAATIFGYVTLLGVTLLGGLLTPETIGWRASVVVFVTLFCVMLWLAFAVVRHAESLATLLGEPYGTLILTLSVIGIEVALIASIMITGSNKPTLARDTMFSVIMIVLNGLVGLSLLTGGLRHRFQNYNLEGATAYLAVLIPLAALSLILPRYSPAAPGGELTQLNAAFLIGMSVILYGVFLGVQTITHSDIFQQPIASDSDIGDGDHHGFAIHSVPHHCVGLLAAMLPIVLLSKSFAIYMDFGVERLGAPLALGGFLIAALILTPEGLSAIQAARKNKLQRAVNICLGSSLSTIGLTVPAVLTIGWVMNKRVELGLEPVEIVLLSVTLFVSLVTFVSARTNVLFGVVHLALFAAYVMMIFDTYY